MKHLPILLILLTLLLIPFCPVLAVTPTHKSNYPSGAIFGYDTASSTYRVPAVSTDGKLSVDANVSIGSVSAEIVMVGPTSFATDPAYISVVNHASFPAHIGPTGFSTDTVNVTVANPSSFPSTMTISNTASITFSNTKTSPVFAEITNPASFPAHVGPTGFATDVVHINDDRSYFPGPNSTVSVGPNTPVAITFATPQRGCWINSFGGVTIFGDSTITSGTFYQGTPIASGSGKVWIWHYATTTPGLYVLMNGGVTGTDTIQGIR